MNSLNGKILQTKTTNTAETELHQSAMLRGNERQSDCNARLCQRDYVTHRKHSQSVSDGDSDVRLTTALTTGQSDVKLWC